MKGSKIYESLNPLNIKREIFEEDFFLFIVHREMQLMMFW